MPEVAQGAKGRAGVSIPLDFLDPTPTGCHAELSPQPSTHGWHLDDFQLLNITNGAVKNVFIAIGFAHDIVIFKDKFLGMKQLG